MAEAATKLPVKTEKPAAPPSVLEWRPFENLRTQVDRLFHDFEAGFLQSPLYRDVENFWRRDLAFPVTPAIDVVEKDNAFEITAELPGLDAKNIELSLSDDILTIKGEKNEEKEEKTKDRYVSERRYGSFRRSLRLPSSVDAAKIDASFKSGVLAVTLPKSAEAQKKQTVIPIATK
ncbi:MAG TPA: Hsp20/alpha crystallin family protein [Bradyrhizobium sp.]|uniref:Hsp20/alpha crystallin family protein n=1 Tax=Bradyrhizobium sp. TaxID=376 RepID=UPI002D7E542F|nr:Hsp20/alpha crystallin family protein [Bradyrhizobium sp.]HET7885784.1 Hsp20/alpha crystallin family protein [Bradyrhizobium sp.]